MITVDTHNMAKLARDLDIAAAGTREMVPVTVRESAELVAVAARGLSSWSSRIPGSIRIAGTGDSAVVVAGGGSAPHAPVFEHGGRPGTFVHPVYGHQPWVPQQARPFLAPAAEASGPAIDRVGLSNVDRVLSVVDL
jgi:hypothetical protein